MAPLTSSSLQVGYSAQYSPSSVMPSLQASSNPRHSTSSLQCSSQARISTSSLQVSFKNTFLSFIDSPRPSLRKAVTSTSMFDADFIDVDFLDSPTDTPEESDDYSWPTMSPRELSSSGSSPKSKCLDTYVASVGYCPRTTVMIRGIPKNYDQEMLLSEVRAAGFDVNFLYLPPGKTKCNRSYGFVNFETQDAAAKFLYSFEGHQWRQRGASKVANVGYATLQGYEQNLEFFSKQEVAKGVSKRSPWVKY